MDIQVFNEDLRRFQDELLDEVPEVIAALATEYYRASFSRKTFDGKAWQALSPKTVKTRGSLLVDSGALANSIRPALVERGRIIISAGNSHVPYAEVHNEGFSGLVNISQHSRKTKKGVESIQAHTRQMNIPQRQFMGDAQELQLQLRSQLEQYIQNKISQI